MNHGPVINVGGRVASSAPEAGLTEDDVCDHVRARLAGYKVPRLIAFDDVLPREESGKIFKRRIREGYWRDAGRAI